MNRGAIILCGGRSSRMGRDKALLPCGQGEVMLQRVVRLVSEAVPAERIVCVAAPGQELPALATSIRVRRDPEPYCGPLAGLAVGMRELRGEVDEAFVCACDMPLLAPAFITRMFELVRDNQAAAVHDGERWHPLGAVFRTAMLPEVEARLAGEDRSLVGLLKRVHTRQVLVAELRDVDPELRSLAGCNTAEEFQAMMAGDSERPTETDTPTA